jgi:hypothetical protein
MKDEFYQFCGWDPQTGVPLTERLEVLDIGWAREHLP